MVIVENMRLPDLPNAIIEKILNEAKLPLWVRLELLRAGFKLIPERLSSCQPIQTTLNYIYQLKLVKYKHYRNTKVFNILSNFSDFDFEINLIEYRACILFKFEKILIDYETGDIYSVRNTTCNALTGDMSIHMSNT